MDPLSITAACIGIVGGIKTTSTAIRSFVRDVHEARHELGATARHLAELEATINLIGDEYDSDDGDPHRQIPESIMAQTTKVIGSCRDILADVDTLLEKNDPRRHRAPLRWALKGKDEALALNRQIEAHTRTLTMALEISTFAVVKLIHGHTTALGVVSGQIRDDTTQIRREMGQILSKMSRLKSGLASQRHDVGDHAHQGRIDIIERYLVFLTDYTESVVDSIDHDGDVESVEESDDDGDRSLQSASHEKLTPHPRQSSSTPTLREADLELETNDVPRQPRPSEWTFPVDSISVLVIGPPGHGKSSLIHRLMHLPDQPTRGLVQPPIGPRVLGQVTVYEAEVSTSKYHLVYKATGEPGSLAGAESNISRDRFKLSLVDRYAPRVKLRLLEANFNYSLGSVGTVESMSSILEALGGLPGTLDAVALVHKLEARPGISADCQRVFRYFEATIPDLFIAPSVVNTHIDPKLGKTTRSWALEARMEEFGTLFPTMKDPSHFLIESPPCDAPLDTELLACWETARLLAFWSSRKASSPPPMPLTPRMRLLEPPAMQKIDTAMAQALTMVSARWKPQMDSLNEECAKKREEIAKAEVKLNGAVRGLKEVEANLAKYDNRKHIPLDTPGRRASLVPWTYQRDKYSKEIRIWKEQKAQLKGDIPVQKRTVEELRKAFKLSGAEGCLREISKRTQPMRNWADELAQEQLPANKRFSQTDRSRYAMSPEGLPVMALFTFIEDKGTRELAERVVMELGVRNLSTSLQSVIDNSDHQLPAPEANGEERSGLLGIAKRRQWTWRLSKT